jgi:hypothetical protein
MVSKWVLQLCYRGVAYVLQLCTNNVLQCCYHVCQHIGVSHVIDAGREVRNTDTGVTRTGLSNGYGVRE